MTEQTLFEKKKIVVGLLMQKNILVTPEILTRMNDETYLGKLYSEMASSVDVPPALVVSSHSTPGRKVSVDDFVSYFKMRFRAMSPLLTERQELSGVTSISRLNQRNDREKVAIIGYVMEKQETKNGNLVLVIEDMTGTVKAIFTKNREESFKKAKDAMVDEVIGILGQWSSNVIFGSDILIPDVPLSHELKKAPADDHMVVLSDIHVGSNNYLGEEFRKFLRWIRGETGSERQRVIASKVKYLFIVGDLVDGVGIYPGQEKELTLPDIREQYKECARLLDEVPSHIRIIICPGNHDGVRIAEPQPMIGEEWLGDLANKPNVTLISNPGTVVIGRTSAFPGFEVLLYHGYSYDYYGDHVESIRGSGKDVSERIGLVMRYLLQRRHLAPSYESTQFLVDNAKDVLVIDSVPDFFLSGHIHKSSTSSYRGVTLISGSCFQARTKFQEKVGHNPDPCRVPVVNLQTRDVTILNFSGENA